MALGLFLSFTNSELVALRDSAKVQMLDGVNRVISQAGAGDVSSEKIWNLEPVVFWEELNFALRRGGLLQSKITRTTPRYL